MDDVSPPMSASASAPMSVTSMSVTLVSVTSMSVASGGETADEVLLEHLRKDLQV